MLFSCFCFCCCCFSFVGIFVSVSQFVHELMLRIQSPLFLSFGQPADSAKVERRRPNSVVRRRPGVLPIRRRVRSWRGRCSEFSILNLKLLPARQPLSRPLRGRFRRMASFDEEDRLGAIIFPSLSNRTAFCRGVRQCGGAIAVPRSLILGLWWEGSPAHHNSLLFSARA